MHKRPMNHTTHSLALRCAPSFIAYYRVSTRRQGRSGLGIEAQVRAVAEYLSGAQGRLVAEFTESESGGRTDRPELARALAACRLHRGTLIVAKLDRLARNAAFLLSLRDAGADFVAADLPGMNRMTVGIMAVVAEEEARMISERTRLALAAAKRRGIILGTPANLSPTARKRGNRASAEVRTATVQRRADDLAPLIRELRANGATSLRLLADGLDGLGIGSPRGGAWTATAVRRVLALIEE
jgi:DNA invertase Pin-like site-specific DNA recombinase